MANWPTGPQPQTATVSPFSISAVLRRHVAGGEDVGEEEHLLVGEAVGNLEGTHVRVGHAHVFGLASGEAAEHVRVAEEARGRMAHRLRGDLAVAVGAVAAARRASSGRRSTLRTRWLKGTMTRSPFLSFLTLAPDLHHLAHGLVAEDVATLHGRHVAVQQVEVRTADGGAGDPDDGVARLLEDRIRGRFVANVTVAMPADRLHRVCSFLHGRSALAGRWFFRGAVAMTREPWHCLPDRHSGENGAA